jgi:hypothetical protein
MTCFTVMLTTKSKTTIEALIVALTINGAAPPSGSGSSPKLVRPGVYFTGIATVLVRKSADLALHRNSGAAKNGSMGNLDESARENLAIELDFSASLIRAIEALHLVLSAGNHESEYHKVMCRL